MGEKRKQDMDSKNKNEACFIVMKMTTGRSANMTRCKIAKLE